MKVLKTQTMERSQRLERTVRSGPALRRLLRSRSVPAALVSTARAVLFFSLALGTFHAHTIRPDDQTVLMAADAVHKGSAKTIDMGPGKVGWVESWDSSASLSWTAKVTLPGSYVLFAILQGSGKGCSVEVTIRSKPLTASCLKTAWERVKLGTIEISAPIQSFVFR